MDYDQEQGPQLKPGTIPRLTRLPMPRPSHDNLRLANTASKREPVKTSTLPRPSRSHLASIVAPAPLGENVNKSLRDRYGWRPSSSTSTVRSRSPVRDALQAAQNDALETTPPNSGNDVPIFEDGNENPDPIIPLEKKSRHRMSLSERTIETLSQISPSPSPTRQRRESVLSSNGEMGPPVRPASSMRSSRPATPSRSRSQSPIKPQFRPPGRSESPIKNVALAAVPSPRSLFSPPRAFVRGGSSRIAKPMRDARRSVSNIAVVNAGQHPSAQPSTYSAQTMRVKTSHHDKSHTNAKSAQSSLEAIFKDPAPLTSKPASKSMTKSNSGLLRPRNIGENTIASSPPVKSRKPLLKPAACGKPTLTADPTVPSPKSSAALRDTISRAKAAKKAVQSNSADADIDIDTWLSKTESSSQEPQLTGTSKGLLRKRLEGALVSGHLNIAAMKLEGMPQEIKTMYEPSELSVNWAEVVDLTKLIVADNEIDDLEDELFPDFTPQEMADDDEKSNQFGGLEVLDCRNNLLRSIPIGFRRLQNLTALNLSGNKLSNNSLEVIWQLPTIQDLDMSRNQLTGELSLSSNASRALRSLNIRENQIVCLAMDVEVTPHLVKLDVSHNKLADLPWETLGSLNLMEVNASFNELTVFAINPALNGFGSLRELDLSSNNIDVMEPELVLPQIQICNMSRNKLVEFSDISTWISLITLYASQNQLTELPAGMYSLPQLKSVDISHNNIKALDPRIANMEALTSLELAGNPLRERKLLNMDTQDIKNDLLKRLEPADVIISGPFDARTDNLDGSDASSKDSTHLYQPTNGILDLSSKTLKTINISTINLEASEPIHTLRLSNNDFTAFPIELLSHPTLKWSLKSLDLSHNPLASTTYLDSDLFLPVLQSLYIVSTGLSSLDALTTHLKAPELTELNISCHRLAGHLPWVRAWFPACTTLLATDNWFSSIDVEAVRGLQVLDVRNNEIETLPPKLGLLGNHANKNVTGRLRSFECGGNRFRVPRITVIEKGTEAVLRDLRRMVPIDDVPEQWKDEI